MIYKEDIAMMNDDVLYKDSSEISKKVVRTLTGLSLLAPIAPTYAGDNFNPNETNMEQLFDRYPDTPYVAQNIQASKSLPNALSQRLTEIGKLRENWDGYGASAITPVVMANAEKFLMLLNETHHKIIGRDDIYPTPYGTIVIEFNNDRGLVSMEISSSQIGFFTDYPGCGNYGSKGIETNFKEIPDQLKQHLQA